MTISKEVNDLIRATQAVCQSVNGSNPQATARQHEADIDALLIALERVIELELGNEVDIPEELL